MRTLTLLPAAWLTVSVMASGPASANSLLAVPHAALSSFAATAAPLMIPEPASAALLIMGLTISAVAARRPRKPKAPPST